MTIFHVCVTSPLGYILWGTQVAATGIGALVMIAGGLWFACHVIDWATDKVARTIGLQKEIVQWIYHKKNNERKAQRVQEREELAHSSKLG